MLIPGRDQDSRRSQSLPGRTPAPSAYSLVESRIEKGTHLARETLLVPRTLRSDGVQRLRLILSVLFMKIEPTTSSPGRKPSPAWRALAGRLLRTPTKTHSERPITPSRSSHLIAVHLEHYTYPLTAQAECVAVHRPLNRSVWGGADTEGGGGVPYLSCHLCTVLLKDNHDVSSPTATGPKILCSFPHAGHIDGY